MMREQFLKVLIYVYNHYLQSDFLKRIIKKIFGKNKIDLRVDDFYINAGVVSSIEAGLIFGTYNEKPILETISQYAKKGFHFLDIGTNVGLHSLTAASANPNIEIYSFEPEQCNFADFLNNISRNGFLNIRPFKIGLGNETCVKKFYVNKGWNKGKHSFKKPNNTDVQESSIPIMKLDYFRDILPSDGIMIKMDVEGFEREVIEGGIVFFEQSKNAALVIELLEEINGKDNCIKIFEMLKSLGFNRICRYADDNKLVEVEDFSGSSDYLFKKGNA